MVRARLTPTYTVPSPPFATGTLGWAKKGYRFALAEGSPLATTTVVGSACWGGDDNVLGYHSSWVSPPTFWMA